MLSQVRRTNMKKVCKRCNYSCRLFIPWRGETNRIRQEWIARCEGLLQFDQSDYKNNWEMMGLRQIFKFTELTRMGNGCIASTNIWEQNEITFFLRTNPFLPLIYPTVPFTVENSPIKERSRDNSYLISIVHTSISFLSLFPWSHLSIVMMSLRISLISSSFSPSMVPPF